MVVTRRLWRVFCHLRGESLSPRSGPLVIPSWILEGITFPLPRDPWVRGLLLGG